MAVELTGHDFAEGTLRRVSYIRPGKLFTAHESILRDRVGVLCRSTQAQVVDAVVQMLRSQTSP